MGELGVNVLPITGWPSAVRLPADLQIVTEGGGQRMLFGQRLSWGIWSRPGIVGAGEPEQRPTHRYFLIYPTGLPNDRAALGCFANPSSATPGDPDPTVNRWIGYCKCWGFGWAAVVNVLAWIATDPKDLPTGTEAVGDWNNQIIQASVKACDLVVCGWGNVIGGHFARVVEQLIRDCGEMPRALRRNKDGSPAHPLYLPGDLIPFAMLETR